MRNLPQILIKSLIIWTSSLTVLGALIISTTVLKGSLYDKVINESTAGSIIGIILLLVGSASFLILFFSSISYVKKKKWFRAGGRLTRVLKIILIILALPLILIFDLIKPLSLIKIIKNGQAKSFLTRDFLKDISFAFLVLIFVFPLWGGSYFVAGYIPASIAGLISIPVPIAGTGSMYPTFPKGHSKDPKELGKEIVANAGMLPYPNGIRISGINILGHEIERGDRGDIVIFQNNKTNEILKKEYGDSGGFVKRVIALPGDQLMIKDGLVYLNGKILKEPYIAKARSTFGGQFLSDCKTIKVTKNKLFVMGDNRKASDDSRIDIGFVDYKDVHYIFPFKNQLGKLDKDWHNPKDDDKEIARTILDKNKYLELLNKKREEEKIKSLTYEPRLEKSSLLRGESMIKHDDFSYEATRSGYTQVRAMNDAGYSNIVWNEGIVRGNYSADELVEYLFEFPDWKKNLLQVKDYQEIGIAEVRGEINGCPAEVIVQHLAGYVPPNYKEEDIQGWGKLISSLNDVIPGWEKIKGYPNVNQDDLNKLLGIMYRRKNNAEAIYYRMKNNQWLTNAEQQMISDDKALYDQETSLANKLNGK